MIATIEKIVKPEYPENIVWAVFADVKYYEHSKSIYINNEKIDVPFGLYETCKRLIEPMRGYRNPFVTIDKYTKKYVLCIDIKSRRYEMPEEDYKEFKKIFFDVFNSLLNKYFDGKFPSSSRFDMPEGYAAEAEKIMQEHSVRIFDEAKEKFVNK